ncbi:alpha/beta hydrolase family protein [Qipengyuania zhejiangensis]|uniref:alpha/beta hydrolase family protein n=1 Tax=Qipengyuania zhejiangensis TaxID=3077782 RepID=UPI002D787CE2|nr:alpha/beta fold hydrolase [Qipengyuania sp. Z2]
MIRTTDGTTVRDVRFAGTNGTVMSALLYVPKNATSSNPAPGILAVHGYINSRETQDGFAIEFARRGYVVLSLDQTGHGYSGGAAFSNGFGGPDGLKYLRSLPMVDTDQIGLEGHSMGGWTVLAAAAAMPDAYSSIVLEGSSTGAPFAQEGSTTWPRNLALVFSRYDEFSKLMWNVDRARDVPASEKLQALFGTDASVAQERLYGSLAEGTARKLYQPNTTHPGDHFSPAAIGKATDWFAATLVGGTPRPASDQIWHWKEFGTAIGLVGFIMIMLGTFDALVRLPLFATMRVEAIPGAEHRDRRWWRVFAMDTALPAVLFFPAFIAAFVLLPASSLLPQAVTTQITLWAVAGAGLSLLIGRFMRQPAASPQSDWTRSIALAAVTVATGYSALWLVDQLFLTDFRLWVVAVKLPSLRQLGIAAIYVVPITFAFLVMARSLANAAVGSDTSIVRYIAAILALTTGFIVMLSVIYGIFFMTGSLITAFDPLSTVIALQFVPVLAAVAVIAIFTWQRTGSYRPGGLVAGFLVTLYVVAGTATQV